MEKRTPWIPANFCRELVYRPPKNMIAEVPLEGGHWRNPGFCERMQRSGRGHLPQGKCPLASELRSGVWGPYSFDLREGYESITSRSPYGRRHARSVEPNDHGPVVDAVDDGCAGSARIINGPLEPDPAGPQESMDHTRKIRIRANHLSLVVQTEGLSGRGPWKVEYGEVP